MERVQINDELVYWEIGFHLGIQPGICIEATNLSGK